MAGSIRGNLRRTGTNSRLRVEGHLVFNNNTLRLNSALAGLSLAYMPEIRRSRTLPKAA